MDDAHKHTALFFGFLASAMTYAAAQAPANAATRTAAPTAVVDRVAATPAPRLDPRMKTADVRAVAKKG